jgi:hypothetical protein
MRYPDTTYGTPAQLFRAQCYYELSRRPWHFGPHEPEYWQSNRLLALPVPFEPADAARVKRLLRLGVIVALFARDIDRCDALRAEAARLRAWLDAGLP